MAIRWTCQHCGVGGKAPDSEAGKLAACPKCGGVVEVPSLEPTPPPTPIQQPEPKTAASKNRWTWQELAPFAWRASVFGLVFAFLATLRIEPGFGLAVHYGSLLLAVGLVTMRIAQRFTKRWAGMIAFVVSIAVATLWGRSDYYIEHWSERSESGDVTLEFTDYIYRGQGRPFYRDLYSRTDKGDYFHVKGGFSESFKRHGKWDSYSSRDFKTNSEWFWYGEPVSEGEWHLRNR